MTGKSSSSFDAGSYWQRRVGIDADVATVGHRAMGPAYNAEIYARRIEALKTMLGQHFDRPLERARVLDIGCGSGFYTGFWKARGVLDYTGLDISSDTIGRLAKAYPEYQFIQADISAPLPATLINGPAFDIITAFDVLYHIVDDRAAQVAITNSATMLDHDGRLFVMDCLSPSRYRISKHVIYRARDTYLDYFHSNHLSLTNSELLFHFLVPPISGIKIVDFLCSGSFNIFGRIIRLNDRFATWIARQLRRLDQLMRERGVSLQNCELLVFVRERAVHNRNFGQGQGK